MNYRETTTISHSAEDLVEQIVLTAREPMLLLDEDFRIGKTNPAFCRQFGFLEDEVIGEKIFDIGSGVWNTPEMYELLNTLLSQEESPIVKTLHQFLEEGSYRTVKISASRLAQPPLLLLCLEDTHSQSHIQEKLHESEEKFRKIFHLNTVPTIVSTLDEGRILDVNGAFERVTGHSRKESVGKTSAELNFWRNKDLRARLASRLATEQTISNEEVEIQTRSGEIRTLLASANRIDIDGVQCLLASAIDITDRKRAQEDYLVSERNFRAAFNNAPIGMVMTDLEGNFLHVNEAYCQLTGYTRKELLQPDFGFQKHTHPDDLKSNVKEFDRLLCGEIPTFFAEKRYIRKDGEIIWVRASATARCDKDGNPFQVVGLVENITKQKEAQKAIEESRENLNKAKLAAEEANRAKSEFLANMSHEIRTPMTVILAGLEHLQDIDAIPEHKTLLEMIDKAVRHLNELIDDILDFSEIEARHVVLGEEPFVLRPWLSETVEMFRLAARKKNICLETKVADNIPEIVLGDPGRIGQVIVNLIGNAIKFTPEGEICVTAEISGDDLKFSVSDTGIGIPEDKQHLLFESFSQVDRSLRRQYGGSGLGLAICKGLVELMNGDIFVRSKDDAGAEFIFTIPLKTVPAEDPSDHSEEREDTDDAVARILIADDDPLIRKVTGMSLRKKGWHVDEASSGSEVVQMFEEGSFNVILMDLAMPGMDGLEATRAIREREKNVSGNICIVGFTAHARKEIIDQCLAAGMQRVLTKPIQMKDLLATIQECLIK